MNISITNHAFKRGKQRMGWSIAETIEKTEKEIKEFLHKNPSYATFDDEFNVSSGLVKWVVVKEDEKEGTNYVVVTIKKRF